MDKEASIPTLFHELCHGPWPDDDPEFLAEVRRYEGALKRMFLLDSQLTHHIESQPLLDSDQIASTPVVQSVHKVQLVATCVPAGHQILFQLSSSPFHLTRLFSQITVEVGSKTFRYLSSSKPTESIKVQFDATRASQVRVTGRWNFPLFKLSPNLAKLMGVSVAIEPDIATRILGHIDARNLCQCGEVRCDAALRYLSGQERFPVTCLGEIIAKNVQPLDPLSFTLDLPQGFRAFNLVVPDIPAHDIPFSPIRVPPPPIRKFLEAAIESKEHLRAIRAFECEPEAFIDEMLLREARMQDADDVCNSSYFFIQPWVAEAASDMLKSSEYVKNVTRKAPTPPQPKIG